MKKKIVFFLSVIFIFMFNIEVQALTGTADVNDYLILRNGPGTSYNEVAQIYPDVEFNILDTSAGSGNGCSNSWYKISFGNNTGYVCGTYVKIKKETISNNEDDSYDRSNYDKPTEKNGTIMCYEDVGDVTLRTSPDGSYTSIKVSCGEEVNVISSSETSSEYWWWKISTSKGTGYIKNIYVNTLKLSDYASEYYSKKTNGDTKESYSNKLVNAGFPTSYVEYLLELHARYPKWNFVSEQINFNFDDAVDGESGNWTSLLQESAFTRGYLSMNPNSFSVLENKFYESSDTGWYNASKEAIAYFMDPRNYLNQRYIFAFETLGFSDNHSTSLISSVINGQNFFNNIYSKSWGDGTNSASGDILSASKNNNISALHVASRIKQEMGDVSSSDSRLGGSFTYNGNWYSGYYNFFNIKSSCSNCSSIYTGYAYENGWNTPYKGINGGANFLGSKYISINQDNIYYQKYDVSRTNYDYININPYTHQYMQNIEAPIGEGGKMYLGYYSTLKDYLSSAITFVIPVYKNMPNYHVTAPKKGDPNNYLKDLTVNGNTVANFSYNTYNYNVHLSKDATTVKLGASVVTSKSSVSGTGNINIDSNNQTNYIYVTSENGKVRKYTIVFSRDAAEITTVADAMNNSGFKYNDKYIFGIDIGTNTSRLVTNILTYNNSNGVLIKDANGNAKTNDIFKTGDTVTITGSDGSKTYEVVIYGDVNGDGKVSAVDYMKIKNYILKKSTIKGANLEAADVNKDGKISAVDYMKIKNHILKKSTIIQ